MKKELRFLYLAYCFLSILFCLMGFDAFYHQKYFTAFAFFSVAVAGLGYCWNLISKKIRETEKIINSIQQKDFLLYPKTIPGEDLKNSAVKLYYQSKEEYSQLYSYKNLYDTILNKLEIRFLEQSNRTIIQIEDSGEGIKPEIINKIFLPFFTTRQNGSGIGLTLSKSIIDAHKGYLTFKNREQGSVFEIWLVQ